MLMKKTDFRGFIDANRLYYNGYTGGVAMNEFEHDVQSKRNDFLDSAVGFVVAFVAFSAIFVVATIVEFVAR